MHVEKNTRFVIACTLTPLGANTSEGFRHSGYIENFKLHIKSTHLSFSGDVPSIAQAKDLAVLGLKKYYSPADISGEIEYYVDRRIAERWIEAGYKKRGQRCTPREYQAIKDQKNLLNIPLFRFSSNDEFGHGLGVIVPYTDKVLDARRGRSEGFSPINGEGGAMTKKNKAWSMPDQDWLWLESQSNQSEIIREAIALYRQQKQI